MKRIVHITGFSSILGGALLFGLLGRPIEMGLAIVAGAIALVFSDLEKFRSFSGAGFTAEVRDQLEAVVEKETESHSVGDDAVASPHEANLDEETKAVLNALHHSEYTWRYISGIRKDSGLDRATVERALGWLVDNGYVRRSQGKHGPIWSLTDDGRLLFMFQ